MEKRIFQAIDTELPNVTAFLEKMLEETCSMKSMMQIMVCLEEMFVNVAHYAYPNQEGSVAISLDITDGIVSVTLEDEGIPFNPLEKTDPDITLPADERDAGGLGILMVKKTMDEISYEYKAQKNVFCMKKKIK